MIEDKRVPINKDNISITRDIDKCINCGTCKSVCKYSSCVFERYKIKEDSVCINCGQCTLVCPVNSLHEVYDYIKLKELIKQKEKIFIFQTAPAVRVALGEEFGLKEGTFVEGKMISSIRKLGADYVFDTTFGADLTAIEEACELIKRLKTNTNLPLFTSCCPAWVKYIEIFKPELIPNLSTTKSPILMQGTIIKEYFTSINNIDKDKIISVAITPCTAKKEEIKKDNNIDYVITTKELAMWLKEENINLLDLEDSNYDDIMDKGSGGGIIFGSTGGVCESVLRCVDDILEGNNKELLNLKQVRGLEGIKEITFTILNKKCKVAVVSQIKNAKKLFNKLEEYDFIEVMACRGGCVAGAGQPKTTIPLDDDIRLERSNSLYKNDSNLKIRSPFENKNIINLYKNYLEKPMSKKSLELLHTNFKDESYKIDRNL